MSGFQQQVDRTRPVSAERITIRAIQARWIEKCSNVIVEIKTFFPIGLYPTDTDSATSHAYRTQLG
jgi:hypothetical protein